MGVNRQQAQQGGLASHQLVNVREQEDGNITRELTSSQAVETQQHSEKEKKRQYGSTWDRKSYSVTSQRVQTQQGARKNCGYT